MEVHNTSFNVIFTLLTIVSLLINLLSPLTVWHFYLMALPSLFYLMTCLHLYKALRELCGYCKYSIAAQLLWIGIYAWTVDEVPSVVKWLGAMGFVGSLIVRGLARKERAKQRVARGVKK